MISRTLVMRKAAQLKAKPIIAPIDLEEELKM
jgi:hypothetical protein